MQWKTIQFDKIFIQWENQQSNVFFRNKKASSKMELAWLVSILIT
ncbi:hypothetical protein PROSTU_02502 [Providencia stuartii ATCC 25827]|uniref:Uncharacterized protein n=1 Tax=Providencia stuartii ATCC 25827 TaxID=471874 RepID=A0AA87CU85_PROST|nr:hypothetical protein PROSTU_02502 [Providencia stuartii ATCC 25827]